MFERLGGRKVFLGLLVMAVGVIVDSLAPKGLTTNLLELLKYIGVGFFISNSAVHAARAIRDKETVAKTLPEKPIKEVNEVKEELEIVKQSLDKVHETNIITQKALSRVVGDTDYIIKAAGLDKQSKS